MNIFKKAFTLAEIMIVLTIIGILTAILLPIAINSAPDENVMKFKKGNNTLGTVIRELVNSDKYYADGDLGIRADGTLIDGTHDGDNTYFCETFADVVSTKSVNCSKNSTLTSETDALLDIGEYFDGANNIINSAESVTPKADERCKNAQSIIGAEIKTTDDIVFFQTTPKITYGIIWTDEVSMNNPDYVVCRENDTVCKNARLFAGPNIIPFHKDKNGFDRVYKIFCMDIDGIDKGEDPFGYGIRADGKIVLGARAQEWLKKSIQKGE